MVRLIYMIKITQAHVKTFVSRSWLRLVAVVMLLVAVTAYFSGLYTLPYAFYQLMCWAVVIESLIIVWQTYKNRESRIVLWIFALVAVVFNPITPIYLSTLVWQFADLAVVVLFVLSFFLLKEKKS